MHRLLRHRTWPLLVSGLSLIAVCYGLARFAYGLFVPAFRSEFQLSDTLLGTIGAGSYVGYCLAIVSASVAVPRFGARRVAVGAGTIATVGLLTVALAPTGAVLAVGVLVAGASTGVASPPLADAVTRAVALDRQDRAQAIVNAGTGAGIAVSGPVALLVAGSWRLAWVGFAVLAVGATVWVARTVPPAPAVRPTAGWAATQIRVATDRRSWRLAAAAALFGVASSGVWMFGRDHLVRVGGLTDPTSSVLWIVLGVAGLVGLVAGDVVARWGLGRGWRYALGLLAAASASLGLFGTSVVVVAATLTVFGGAYIVLTAVVLLWAVRLHPDQASTAVGFGFLLLALGQAAAAPVVGLLVEHAGTGGALLACAAVGSVAAWLLRPDDRS